MVAQKTDARKADEHRYKMIYTVKRVRYMQNGGNNLFHCVRKQIFVMGSSILLFRCTGVLSVMLECTGLSMFPSK